MIARVLVPLDGSELADRVLAHVRKLLPSTGGEVVLVRVLEERPLRAEAADAARAHLERVRAELEGAGHRATVRLVAGEPASRILEAADEFQPSLIAVASHGRSGLLRWIRGSTAERLLAGARHPILIATPGSLPASGTEAPVFHRILVPVDGSRASDRILPIVAEVARAHGSLVQLLHVVEVDANALAGEPLAMQAASVERESAQRILDRASRALAGQRLETLTGWGDPASAILEAAREHGADLLALTTHGLTGASRWLFGSVADQVLHQARCPLLVLRPGGAREEG